MAEDPGSTNPRWWSLDQTLVWIVLRIEMLPQDAGQIANSPEINPEIEEAWNQLKREFWKSVLGVPKGIPIDKFRIPCGRGYTDLLTLFQVPSAEPGALSTAMDLFERDVRWQDVEYYSVWVKRTFPAPAPAVEVAAPTVSAPVPSMPEEAPPPAAHPGAPVAAESEEPVTETPPVSAADEETTPAAAAGNQPSTEQPATIRPKNKGGAPDKWAWERLIPALKKTKQGNQPFQDMADLEEFCRNNVQRADRKAERGDDPDLRSVKAAIIRYGLADYVAFEPPDADVQ